MKHILILAALTMSFSSFGQTFRVPKNARFNDFNLCQDNHNRFYARYGEQIDSQIRRLIRGLEIEQSMQTPEHKIQFYRRILVETVVKRLVLEELIKQFNARKLSEMVAPKSLQGTYHSRILHTEDIRVNLQAYFETTVEKALRVKELQSYSEHLKAELKEELLNEAATTFLMSAYRSLGNGLLAKIVAGTLAREVAKGFTRHALLSFGANVVKGALKGALITILAEPLYGGRLPPETIWLDALRKYPELIINPEWMKEAGSPDHPWTTHCATIIRRTEALEQVVTTFLNQEERSFIASLTSVNNLREPVTEAPNNTRPKSPPLIQRDNTYVRPPVNARIALPPPWAR
jgi:hypothetical protein